MKKVTVIYGMDKLAMQVPDTAQPRGCASELKTRIALGYHGIPVGMVVDGNVVIVVKKEGHEGN